MAALEEEATEATATVEENAPPAPMARLLSFVAGGSDELSLYVDTFKPMTERTAEGKKALVKGWRMADPNGNGICSLAELDSFVKNMLITVNGRVQGTAIFKLFRPSIIRAYYDAKDYKADDGTNIAGTSSTADDFVSKGEFKLFVGYAVIYAAMYDGFSTLDGYGEGRESDDRRVDLDEWLAGYEHLISYGFVAFEGITDGEMATAVFHSIDSNGGGYVMLNEYCAYVKDAEITNNTALGALLAAEE